MHFLKGFLLLGLVFGCASSPTPPTGEVASRAMVVSARKEASAIGLEILRKGGNAFDAMVATELALAVAYPYAGNLGGGGFMVYRLNNGEVGSLDYREKAPLTAAREMYLDSLGEVLEGLSIKGATAAGVPGTIAGVFAVHEKFGSLPMSELMAPAIALAEKGVQVTELQARNLAQYRELINEVSGDSTLFFNLCKPGDSLKFPNLARTLKRISTHGRDEFYKGETAATLTAFMQERGGYLSAEDLAAYEVEWRQPVIFKYRDLRVISMSLPSSGGITLNQMLWMMEPYKLEKMGFNSAQFLHLFSETARRAYADRNHFLGDPDFVSVPLDVLLSRPYIRERMENFSPERASPASAIRHGETGVQESPETTHYVIIDSLGNAVSATTTLNGAYGSKLYCQELGFFMNNEMDDFSSKPGTPNMFGLVGAEANSIAPGKRMLSSMTPTLVEKEGRLWLALGTNGGSTIITAVAQTLLNVHAFGLSMQEAVDAPRFHHQGIPDKLVLEPGKFSKTLADSLRNMGYRVEEHLHPINSKLNAIRVLEDGRLEGGADHRGDNSALGY